MKKDSNPLLFRMLFICICSILLIVGCKSKVEQSEPDLKESPEKAEFVDKKNCIECHEDQYNQWDGSHHDLAMDVATDKTVIGDFNNSTFLKQGVTSTFYKKDGKFIVRTDGPDGELHDYEISYVFGADPLQQYMIKFPDGRIHLPDIGWDNRQEEEGGQRWVDLNPEKKITPWHIFHWTGRFLNWNSICAECHSTNIQKNYDLETNTFNTTWSEIDVGCQACHGPGSNHVEWARSVIKTDGVEYTFKDMKLEVDLDSDNSHIQIEACARCHALRSRLQKDYEYGKPLMDYYVPQVLIEPFYYPDGQVQDEVYVYGSYIQSKKYQRGVRCTDCHDPHTSKLHAYGNELCINCHSSPPPQGYENLKDKEYDSPTHHFHKEGSSGSECVECHMPSTEFMVVDSHRDHSFQIPRPDLGNKLNIPNACNRCHKDKSAQWAAEIINEVHPLTQEKRQKEMHFAEVFAAGQAHIPDAQKDLFEIINDREKPAIIRATALNILSGYMGKDAIDVTALSLMDDEPLVRYEAVRGISVLISKSLGPDEQEKKYSLLVPLLKDSIFAVRAEAARALTEVPAVLFNENNMNDFNKALEEYKHSLESRAERPESHLNIGLMYENTGQNDKAESSYKTAIRLVNDFMPARFNLANLYNRTDRNNEAEQQFKDIIALEPENGQAHYSLGLLLAEENRLDVAADSLARAVELVPDHAIMHYNYSLALRHLGRDADALTEMLIANKIDPDDSGIIQALTIFYIQKKEWGKAYPYAQKLVELFPSAPGPKQMLKQIEQEIKTEKKKIE